MTVPTETGGRQNMFPTEPPVDLIEENYFVNAERVNGQLAMIGIVSGLGAYITTGQLIPGIF